MRNPDDYSDAEREKIAALKASGNLSTHCPNGHFWLRDYDFPVRCCPFCGEFKPWADREKVNA